MMNQCMRRWCTCCSSRRRMRWW